MTEEDPQETVEESVSTIPGGSSGPGKNEMVQQYLPDSDDYNEKTILDLEDPARIAVLRNISDLYPEVEELQEPIDGFLDEFLPAKVSVGGQGRSDFNSILRAMFGATDDDDNTGQVLANALGVNEED